MGLNDMKHPFAPLELVAQMTAQLTALQSQLEEIKQYVIETIDLADPDAIAFEPDEPLPIAVVKPAPEPTLADEVAYLEADTPTTLEDVVKGGRYYVLDTETTGIGDDDEIVEIAIVDQDGNAVINTFVKPAKARFDRVASSIHSIKETTVQNAPTFASLYEQIIEKLDPNTPILIYNADFDRRLIAQTMRANGITPARRGMKMHCVMLAYAKRAGEWNSKYGNYRWHKLTDACRAMGIPVHNAHTALGDAQMTLELVKAMYGKVDS